MKKIKKTEIEYGDVIAVKRLMGLYMHYGVYIDDNHIVHFAPEDNEAVEINKSKAVVHTTDIDRFLKESLSLYVLTFPEKPPVLFLPTKQQIKVNSKKRGKTQIASGPHEVDIGDVVKQNYHLFSPNETVQRALSQLGVAGYNLPFNNCEHFAIWCKTNLSKSTQIDYLMHWLAPAVFQMIRRIIPFV